ncbi:acyltransferase family protein [Yinghuangia seranimata]|uniref:acyltransferase family protein n=1 Tax=Yinghuangia seranimata TaxID=408067 RepID=UPI00248AB48D|nr:acyltransferase [Yinghuangia seranimata]MDI2130242.1 acyltransferase [Yinghuangia seranimata]
MPTSQTLPSEAAVSAGPAGDVIVEPVAPAPAPAPRRGRLPALDGMRFVAATVVMLHHLVIAPYAWHGTTGKVFHPLLVATTAYGFLGVEFFFLISGFVICMSSWGRSLGQFFTSRVTRLYPAYWAAMAVTTLVVWYVADGNATVKLSKWDRLVNLTMFQEPLNIADVDTVYWTLWVEMRFYLLFAIVVFLGVTYRRVLAFCVLWSVAAILVTAVGNSEAQYLLVPNSAPFFVAGIAFYLMHRNGPNVILWGVIGFSFAVGQHNVIQRWQGTEDIMRHKMPEAPVHIAVTVFFVLMAALALGWLDRINWGFLTTLGALTYPVYLLHCEAGWALVRALRGHYNANLVVAMVVAWVFLVAWLIHVLVEKRLAPRLGTLVKKSFATMPRD